MWKKIGLSFLGLVVVAIVVIGYQNYPKLGIVSGYAAKKMCSCTFIAGRTQESIQSEDLAFGPLAYSSSEIDRDAQRVTSSVFGIQKRTAEYRSRLGCVLIHGHDDFGIQYPEHTSSKTNSSVGMYPYGDQVAIEHTKDVDMARVKFAADNAFDDGGMMTEKRTRALLIIHKDTVLYERYANGYDADTEILGWSMTKSIMNAWVGMMIGDGKISLADSSLFDEWKEDNRAAITLNDLLHMSSGLDWSEVYSEISPATKMLYESENNGWTARQQGMEADPGVHWEYSSGTSNIISSYLRDQFTSHDDYLRYPHERIFGPLGMKTAHLEIDESGSYIGSSYCYATARDWGRFGTLYLRDGMWQGARLLPEGWVEYSSTIVPDSKGKYAAHFWANVDGAMYPDAPHDMFSANGYEGQLVAVLPSQDMVIVRLGLNSDFDFNTLLTEVSASVLPER